MAAGIVAFYYELFIVPNKISVHGYFMDSLLFLLPFCIYIVLTNYVLKKRFNIGLLDSWSDSDVKMKDAEIIMPFVALALAFFFAFLTYLSLAGLMSLF